MVNSTITNAEPGEAQNTTITLHDAVWVTHETAYTYNFDDGNFISLEDAVWMTHEALDFTSYDDTLDNENTTDVVTLDDKVWTTHELHSNK